MYYFEDISENIDYVLRLIKTHFQSQEDNRKQRKDTINFVDYAERQLQKLIEIMQEIDEKRCFRKTGWFLR